MSPISTLAVVCLTLLAPGQTAPKATPLPDQSGRQVITLFDLRSVGSSGGANPSFSISGRGYPGTPDDRLRVGKTSEPDDDEMVHVVVRDARDPAIASCLHLMVPEVFMEHTVRMSGTGRIEPRASGDDRLVTLTFDALSECRAVARR